MARKHHSSAVDPVEALFHLGLPTEGDAVYLARRLRIELIKASGNIFEAGAPADALYVIVEEPDGKASLVETCVEQTGSGKAYPLERIVAGIFGELEFGGRDEAGRFPVRMLSARTLSPVRLFRVPYAALLSLEPELLTIVDRRLATVVVQRLRNLLHSASIDRSSNRSSVLAAKILQLLEDAGIEEGGGLRLRIRRTQQELADEVGLSREAVNGHLAEWTRAGLLSFDQGSLAIRDMERMRQLVALGRGPSRAAHDRNVARTDTALSSGDTFRARNLTLQALDFFPGSPVLQQRAVLAAARCGAFEEARALLNRFQLGSDQEPESIRERVLAGLRNPAHCAVPGERDGSDDELLMDDSEDAQSVQVRLDRIAGTLVEDTLALAARIAKDRYWSLPPGRARDAAGREALEGYDRAFKLTDRSYSGINAASLALTLGERGMAESYAQRIITQLKNAKDYWGLVTLGEAYAIAGNWDRAAACYKNARALPDASPGNIASSRLQLVRLRNVLGAKVDGLLAELSQVGVIAFSGHMMLGDQLDADEQKHAASELVQRLTDVLDRHDGKVGFGALAAGSDILFAETLIAAQGAFNAVLPFRVEDFVSLSVLHGNPSAPMTPDWNERFATCLARSTALSICSKDRLSTIPKNHIDEILYYSNRRAIGLALLKADELVTDPVILTVYDGAPPAGIAGTARVVSDCAGAGLNVVALPCSWRKPAKGSAEAQPQAIEGAHRAVLFAWIVSADQSQAPRRKTKEQIQSLLGKAAALVKSVVGSHVRIEQRVVRQTSVGLVMDFPGTAAAIEAGRQLAEVEPSAEFDFRLFCDFGPVASTGSVSMARISRLDGADDIPDLPARTLIASEAFAAEARLANSGNVSIHTIGRAASGENGAGFLPLPSVPLYRVGNK